MSKIVQAVNAMLTNKNQITPVIEKWNQFFFLYKDKYIWSIRYEEEEGEYTLSFYPEKQSIEEIVSTSGPLWQYSTQFIAYKGSDIGTHEAIASFRDLYLLIKEKVFGVDKVLDDIIKDDKPF